MHHVNHRRAITTCLLTACLLVVAIFLAACQGVRYDIRVTTDGTIGAPAEGAENASDEALSEAACATAPAELRNSRQLGAQNVTVNLWGVTGTTAKPIEVSPGRELSPAREAVVSDNVVEGLPTP
ncbi:MAG: hypothetical protein WC977_03985 [Anaerovoracaceae bacterium]|jgi:predicted small secreted protein